MKNKTIVFSIALLLMLTIGLVAIPVMSVVPSGPKTPELLIHVFANPDIEFGNLETGVIDIVDWPLTKTWIDKWSVPPYSADIEMRSYAEIGHMEFDINNQRWPTGVTTPRVTDPDSGTPKHFYDSTPASWDDEATEFRKAIAYLTDKEGYVTRILKGFGYAQDTNVAYPECGGWVPPPTYVSPYSGLAYSPITFDPDMAATILDDAGFVQNSDLGTNPSYDDTTTWSAEFMREDPRNPGIMVPELVFYLRMDDPQRRDAGRELTTMLKKSGIRVNSIETERTVCYKQCMVLYDYHLYTGGWSLSADAPDSMHFLAHSSMYWGGQANTYYGGIGWSSNYAGFAHNYTRDPNPAKGVEETYYDYWAVKAKYPASFAQAMLAGHEAQVIETHMVPMIPLWAAAAVKAYGSHFDGIVNGRGYGIDNYWSFLNAYSATDARIDWGFKSNLEGPNPIASEWVWDWNILGLIYDTLIGRNPFNLAQEFGWLSSNVPLPVYWSPGKMSFTFTLRDGAKFHNGDPVMPIDVAFSLIFMRDCGPGVCWVYSDIKDIVEVRIPQAVPSWLAGADIVQDGTLASNEVEVRFSVDSYWALHWAGFQIILNEATWKAANDANGWGYTGVGKYQGFTNRMKVREYAPWTEDSDGDGIVDMSEEGTGAWIFKSATPLPISTSTALAFVANNPGRDTGLDYADTTDYIAPGFYLSQAYISAYLDWAFHLAGDCNDDGEMTIADGFLISKALRTDMWNPAYMPHGPVWNKYNPDADVNTGIWDMIGGTGTCGDGYINAFDNNVWGFNYGLKK